MTPLSAKTWPVSFSVRAPICGVIYGLNQPSQVVLEVRNPPANAGDMRCEFETRVGKMPWWRACNPLLYSCLENPMDRGTWQATVYITFCSVMIPNEMLTFTGGWRSSRRFHCVLSPTLSCLHALYSFLCLIKGGFPWILSDVRLEFSSLK